MFNQQVEEYTRAFIKEFGTVDPNQTWNTAQSTAITLDLGSGVASSIKMYCKVDNQYYIIANLVNLSGVIDVPVDIPESSTEIMVKVDGTTYYAQPGTTINCPTSRASRATTQATTDISVSTLSDWYVFDSYATMYPIVNTTNGIVPESNSSNNGGKGFNSTDYPNDSRIVQDFIIDPGDDHKFTVYPMFYGSNLIHTLGVYYEVSGTLYTKEIYTSKQDSNNDGVTDEMQIKGYANETQVELNNLPTDLMNRYYPNGYATFIDESGNWLDNGEWPALCTALKTAYENGEITSLSSYSPSVYDITYINGYNTNRTSFDVMLTLSSGEAWTSINTVYDDDKSNADSYDVYNSVQVRTKGYEVTVPSTVNRVGMYLISKPNPADLSAIYTGTYPPYMSWSDVQNTYTESANNLDSYFTPYTHYSQKQYNTLTYGDDSNEDSSYGTNTYYLSYASSFAHPTTGDLYFAFEDWPIKKPSSTDVDTEGYTHNYSYSDWTWGNSGDGDYSSDRDLNDLIFRIQGASITGDRGTIVEKDVELSWIWAAEDLGATDDFDFNDMVMKISTITTNIYEDVNGVQTSLGLTKKITFTPLAAGGTLPLYVHWNEYSLAPGSYYESGATHPSDATDISTLTQGTEWHKWFHISGSTVRPDNATMLNTGYNNINFVGDECTIYLNASSFTVGNFGASNSIDGVGTSGLYISINDDRTLGESYTEEIDNWTFDNTNDVWVVTRTDTPGKASQMFMIDDATDTWAWPKEREHIMDAYPGFQTWVGDKSTIWYKSPATINSNYTVTR